MHPRLGEFRTRRRQRYGEVLDAGQVPDKCSRMTSAISYEMRADVESELPGTRCYFHTLGGTSLPKREL